MAKVSYDKGSTSQYGYEFEAGKPTEVAEGPSLEKFRGNPHFSVEKPKAKGKSKPKP